MRRLILALSILITCLSGYAESVMQNHHDDEGASRALRQSDIDGARRGDPVEMSRAFHNDATVFGWFYRNPDDLNEVRLVLESSPTRYELIII